MEYYKIKDVYKRIKGTPITAGKMKEIATPDGSVRIFAGGKTVINANEKDIPNANITRVPAVLVQSRGVIDAVYYDKPFTFKNEMWAYSTFNQKSVKYLYYILKSNIQTFRDAASGMGALPQISLGVTEEFEIPVPPLPVQEEIVRILDTFTELQAELQAELQKRLQQYNFYRDNLLNFKDINRGRQEIKWMKMSDVCSIKGRIGFRGYTRNDQVKRGEGALSLSPSNISNGKMDYSKGTYITWTKYDESPEIQTFNGDIIFCKTASIGKVAFVTNLPCKATINPQLVVLKDIKCSARFLAYFLETNYIQNIVMSLAGIGSVPNISQKALSDILIPIPPLEEQNRIVSILDRFDTLTNDLTQGLPAEIEKRRQQYEFYRDKLLTFKRKEA